MLSRDSLLDLTQGRNAIIAATDEGRQPAIRAIAAALRRQASQLRVNDLECAAEQFISLVIDSDLRLAAFGIGPAPDEIEGRVRQAVDLFLHGVCGR